MSSMPWGGFVSMLVGGAVADASGKISDRFRDVSHIGEGFTKDMASYLMSGANNDWNDFKTNYRPVGEGLAKYADRNPDYATAEGGVTAGVGAGTKAANKKITEVGSQRGVAPASGNMHAAMVDTAANAATTEGQGFGLARQSEDQDLFNDRMNVVNQNRGNLALSNMVGGKAMDLENLGARRYLKMSDAYAGAEQAGMGGVGRGIGRLAGSLTSKNNSDTTAPASQHDSTYGTGGDYGFDENEPGLKDGGLIRGPGTGRSDSVPANIDGKAPARVSNGEYHVPAYVVRYFGTKFFDELNERYSDSPQDATEQVGGL